MANFCQYTWMTLKWLERSRFWAFMWKEIDEKMWILTNQHHFLTTCTGDALSGNRNRMKQSLNSTQRCLSHAFLLEQQKITRWEKPHAKTVAWSYDMEGHAPKCVERYCAMANKKVEQLYKVSHFLFGRSSVQKGGTGIKLERCQKFARKLS